jgi:hypothetical protein
MYMIMNMIWQVIAMTMNMNMNMNMNMTMRGHVEPEPLIFKVRPVL